MYFSFTSLSYLTDRISLESWDERRALPGPPTTQRNAATVLHNAGVNIGLGVSRALSSL